MFASAEGMHYTTVDGRKVIDGTAGLWCCQRRPRPPRSRRRRRAAADEPRLRALVQSRPPAGVRFRQPARPRSRPRGSTASSSPIPAPRSVDTALKIALAYQRAAAQADAYAPDRPRARLSRRRFRRHVGRRHGAQPPRLRDPSAGVDHIRTPTISPATPSREDQPEHGAELADELERMVELHGADTIAAVIVEPVPGSTGVLPPPQGLPEAPARTLRASTTSS